DGSAVRDDVRTVLGEGARDVLEQPRAIPRVDRDLHPEALRSAAVPADGGEPLRVARERLHVRAVATMDGDALAHRDVADDLVARTRRAALRQPHEDVVDAVHVDPVVLATDRMLRARRLERDGLFLGGLLRLQALQYLVDDRLGTYLPRAERKVEVLRLLEVHVADDLRKHRRAGELAIGELRRLQGAFERFAALLLLVLARLAREPLADLVARTRRRSERQPVARGAASSLRREDLDKVAVLQPIVQRDDAAVDLRADGPV